VKAKQQFGGMLKKRPGALSDSSVTDEANVQTRGTSKPSESEGKAAAPKLRETSQGETSQTTSIEFGDAEQWGSMPSFLRRLRNRFCTIL
jgi:hypothetical protein